MNHTINYLQTPIPNHVTSFYKLRLLVVLGTRPEIIRLSSILRTLQEYLDVTLIHTGQNYDPSLNQIFFEDLDLSPPDIYLGSADHSGGPFNTVANILSSVENHLLHNKYDAFLVLGDTNSCLAALVAKRFHIPIFHLEAGNRCYDSRVPEETNRRVIDHIADVNLCYSHIARENLLREGLPPDQTFNIGSPMYEVITHQLPKVKRSSILKTLGLEKYNYIVISSHREEIVDSDINLIELNNILHKLETDYSLPIFFSIHPRTRKRINQLNLRLPDSVIKSDPLSFSDYLSLQSNSFAVLSDSGTISEEASILKLRAINIRSTHERQEAFEEAPIVMSSLCYNTITQALHLFHNKLSTSCDPIMPVNSYHVPNVSEKVLRIILSYTKYVDTYTWHKS